MLYADWTPDGRYLVLQARGDADGDDAFFVQDVDGRELGETWRLGALIPAESTLRAEDLQP